ncbi:hypothetical protein CcrColossus_gp062 [Caulobacter phage CcrColossus]|uniref:Uncharacterized protein n=1 Tax=Caulobacter phage CcrColossus TaxID=1211640 RepID=K4K623_9CAUD|nr:hypothetical protein CcrColossus_gp062 [Caulobacter phage CcrColossus]AFU87932.1 hypothetical protein CcrColossus_gp062 [Caulobacter phage CcrColossus]
MTALFIPNDRLSLSYVAEDGRVVRLNDVQMETVSSASGTTAPTFEDVSKTIEVTGTLTATFHVDPPWKCELLWATHNLLAHPISEITHWLAYIPGLKFLRDLGLKFHDITVPRHAWGTGRG